MRDSFDREVLQADMEEAFNGLDKERLRDILTLAHEPEDYQSIADDIEADPRTFLDVVRRGKEYFANLMAERESKKMGAMSDFELNQAVVAFGGELYQMYNYAESEDSDDAGNGY